MQYLRAHIRSWDGVHSEFCQPVAGRTHTNFFGTAISSHLRARLRIDEQTDAHPRRRNGNDTKKVADLSGAGAHTQSAVYRPGLRGLIG